jgi:hypothetical protein
MSPSGGNKLTLAVLNQYPQGADGGRFGAMCWLCFVPLLFSFIEVIRLLSDYAVCWALIEGGWKPQIVAWGFPRSLSDLRHVFNWSLFEYEPRLTRPLSSLFELFDTPFRTMLWHVIPPHPSLSLTWILSLFVAPLLLFLVLRQLKISDCGAALAMALYVANPGVLSLESLMFRPGKALANVAILVCLWLAGRQDIAYKQGAATSRQMTISFTCLCLVTFAFLFIDEVALIVYPAIALLFPRIVFRNRETIAGFAMVPVAYAASVKIMLPRVFALAGSPLPPTSYQPADSFVALITFRLPVSSYWVAVQNVVDNARLIVMDSFGLIDPRLAHSLVYCILFSIIVLLGGAFGIRLVLQAARRPLNYGCGIRGFLFDDRTIIHRVFLMLALALVYEGILMTVSIGPVGPRAWGLYYYGVFCVIFLLAAMSLIFDAMAMPRPFLVAFAVAVVAATTLIFPATDQAYKMLHYYPHQPEKLDAVFKNTINRFNTAGFDSQLLYDKTLALWRMRKAPASIVNVPVELTYAAYELGLVKGSTRCEFHTSYFDIFWDGKNTRTVCHN